MKIILRSESYVKRLLINDRIEMTNGTGQNETHFSFSLRWWERGRRANNIYI